MKLIIATVWGLLMGLLTFVVGPLSLASENRVYEGVIQVASWLVIPGLVIGTMTGSFAMGVAVNCALYASLCWLAMRAFEREAKVEEVEEDEHAAR